MLTTPVDTILCFLTRLGIGLLQALPVRGAARLGRFGGEVVFWADGRHRRMAIANLTRCFGHQKSAAEIRALAHENFRRIGENTCCAICTAVMKPDQLRTVLEVKGPGIIPHVANGSPRPSRLFATGHFGNFEAFVHIAIYLTGYQCAATYRGIRQPALNEVFLGLRTGSGTLMFERRTQAEELKRALAKGGVLLTLVADQSTRDGGLEVQFFGQPCFASRAPAVMASRYDCELFVPICYRVGLGRWVIETGEAIPTYANGRRRSCDDITRDINAAMEAAVRRDPANWFWVHNRWKTRREVAPVAAPVTA